MYKVLCEARSTPPTPAETPHDRHADFSAKGIQARKYKQRGHKRSCPSPEIVNRKQRGGWFW